MVLHIATCRDTFVNVVSKQSTLSQVAQLLHCRFWLDTAFQQYSLYHPHLHSICSPHLLHLQHWQPKWGKSQLSLPCQLFKRMPWHPHLWHPMPHLCSHKDLAMPAWHLDAWSRKSENSRPRLSMNLVIITCCCIHPQSTIVVLNHHISYSQKGGCCMIVSFSFKDWSLDQLTSVLWHTYIDRFPAFTTHVIWVS